MRKPVYNLTMLEAINKNSAAVLKLNDALKPEYGPDTINAYS